MSDQPKQIAEAAICVADLAEKLKVQGINSLPGPWVYSWDAPDGIHWRIASNGHRHEVSVPPDGGMGIETLPPFHHAVWRNGWLFGIFHAFGGEFMGADGKGEDEFIAAIQEHCGSL